MKPGLPFFWGTCAGSGQTGSLLPEQAPPCWGSGTWDSQTPRDEPPWQTPALRVAGMRDASSRVGSQYAFPSSTTAWPRPLQVSLTFLGHWFSGGTRGTRTMFYKGWQTHQEASSADSSRLGRGDDRDASCPSSREMCLQATKMGTTRNPWLRWAHLSLGKSLWLLSKCLTSLPHRARSSPCSAGDEQE